MVVDDEKPKLSVQSCVMGGVWLVLSAWGTVAVPKFREMFEEMGVVVGDLPTLSRIVVVPPPLVWMAVGFAVAGLLVAKSLVMSPRDSSLIDWASAAVLLLAGAGAVIGLFLPLISTGGLAQFL